MGLTFSSVPKGTIEINPSMVTELIAAQECRFDNPLRTAGIQSITDLNNDRALTMVGAGIGMLQPPAESCERKPIGSVNSSSKLIKSCGASFYMKICEKDLLSTCNNFFDRNSSHYTLSSSGDAAIKVIASVALNMFNNAVYSVLWFGNEYLTLDDFTDSDLDITTKSGLLASLRRCTGFFGRLNECIKPDTYTIATDANGNVTPQGAFDAIDNLVSGTETPMKLQLAAVNAADGSGAIHVSFGVYNAYKKYLQSIGNLTSFTWLVKGIPTDCVLFDGIPVIPHGEWDVMQATHFGTKKHWAVFTANGSICMGTNLGDGGEGCFQIRQGTSEAERGYWYFDAGDNIRIGTEIIDQNMVRVTCSESFKLPKTNC